MKAIVSENQRGENVNSKIQMVLKNRYILTLKGERISYEELKNALTEINTSRLP